MSFKLKINVDNNDELFSNEDNLKTELESIAEHIYDAISEGITEGTVRNNNGNNVGHWEFSRPLRRQRVTLEVTYDPFVYDTPDDWDWQSLCDHNHEIEIISSDDAYDV